MTRSHCSSSSLLILCALLVGGSAALLVGCAEEKPSFEQQASSSQHEPTSERNAVAQRDTSSRAERPMSDSSSSEADRRPPEKESDEDEIFVVVDQKPDCGGVEALREYVENHPPEPTWPWTATEGRVFVQFVVNTQGEVVNPKVTRSVSEPLDSTAVRAVETLKCEPGMNGGEPVATQMSLPVTFRDG